MFINKIEEFSNDLLTKGRFSSLSNLEERISCLEKLSFNLKNLSLEIKNKELFAFFYFLEESITLLKSDSGDFIYPSLPRGIVLNIPSSNIPMMPFYTWVPSFLAGNINFVRLSRKSDIQLVSKVIFHLDAVLGDLESEKQVFYKGDLDEITSELSLNCDVRMIWGDNKTIKKIKYEYPTSAVLEISYKNRFSASLIDSNEYLEMSITQKKFFLKNYLNDSLSFSFAACSSPQYTFWLGSDKNNFEAQKIFIKDLKDHAQKIDLEKGIITTNNLNEVQSFFVDFNFQPLANYFLLSGRGLALIKMQELKKINDSFLNANTLFVSINSLEELISSFPNNIQTLTYTKNVGTTFIKKFQKDLEHRCPDRIVPFGKALSFNMIWDGTNLLNTLRKKVLIQ